VRSVCLITPLRWRFYLIGGEREGKGGRKRRKRKEKKTRVTTKALQHLLTRSRFPRLVQKKRGGGEAGQKRRRGKEKGKGEKRGGKKKESGFVMEESVNRFTTKLDQREEKEGVK